MLKYRQFAQSLLQWEQKIVLTHVYIVTLTDIKAFSMVLHQVGILFAALLQYTTINGLGLQRVPVPLFLKSRPVIV
jgi:hypothetical protein